MIPLEKIIFSGEIKNIIFDLEEVQFIDSSFIGHLLNIKKKLKIHKKELFLTSLNGRIFDLAVGGEIEQLFTIFSSPQEACKSCTENNKKK